MKNLITFIYSITQRDISFILLGTLIGILINKKTKIIDLINKNPVEILMGLFITFIVVSQFSSNSSITTSNSFDILNFLCNVAFAWILTKYSVKVDYENKQKEMYSMSYSYSLKCENNIDHGIKICQLAESSLQNCERNNGECKLNSYIGRVRDSLLVAKNDVSQNTLNWSLKISTEINAIKKMDLLAEEIQKIEEEIQVLDMNDSESKNKIYNLNRKIKNKEKEITNINKLINPEIKATIESVHLNRSDNAKIIEETIRKEGMRQRFNARDGLSRLRPRDENAHPIFNDSTSI